MINNSFVVMESPFLPYDIIFIIIYISRDMLSEYSRVNKKLKNHVDKTYKNAGFLQNNPSVYEIRMYRVYYNYINEDEFVKYIKNLSKIDLEKLSYTLWTFYSQYKMNNKLECSSKNNANRNCRSVCNILLKKLIKNGATSKSVNHLLTYSDCCEECINKTITQCEKSKMNVL